MVHGEGRIPGGGGYSFMELGRHKAENFDIRDLTTHLEKGF
jgi:hypothetical protein